MTTYLIERAKRDAEGRVVEVMWFKHVPRQPVTTSQIVSVRAVVEALNAGALVKVIVGRSVIGGDVFVSTDGTTIIDAPTDASFKLNEVPEL